MGAHQKDLAAAAALKGEIERLSHPLPQNQPEMRARSKSRDWQVQRAAEQKRGTTRCNLKGCPAPCHPSRRSPESSKEAAASDDLDLWEPLELEPEVACFLGESTGNLGEEDEKGCLKPPVKEFGEWVP